MTETLSASLPTAIERLIDDVLRLADDSDLSLATAESCTGGLLASILTDVEGRSHVFERGFVVYTDGAKVQMLQVAPDLLATYGAVSEPVARAMAEGALQRSGAGLVLAVTGFAGPAGPDDETGLVHFAVASRGGTTTHAVRRFGEIGRGPCRLACLEVALTMMKAALETQQSPSVNRD
ncbi:MAG: CinA family protein [Brevundimonas sp.]|nr:MAG: CinA family protein [Brevundimonas sp.]